jgi:hypothetical protein
MPFHDLIFSQLDSILATDEPSAFLQDLVQGLVTALGGEPGEWSVIKAYLKDKLPSLRTNSCLLSLASPISINFNGDDG